MSTKNTQAHGLGETAASWKFKEALSITPQARAREQEELQRELLRLRDKISQMYGVEELKDVPVDDLPGLIESLLGKVTPLSLISGRVWFRPKLMAFMRSVQSKAS